MTIEKCWRCGADYDSDNRLQTIRHHGAFCVTSPQIDRNPEAKVRRQQGAKRGWITRRKHMAQQAEINTQ